MERPPHLRFDGAIGGLDEDGDGFRACDDCDDSDDTRFPNATEICDSVDNDCDGDIDDADSNVDLSTASTFFMDADGDGVIDVCVGATADADAEP